jgi:hypothetical protein
LIIGVISFFIHILANTQYDLANSNGVISHVPNAKGAQYCPCSFNESAQMFFIKFTIAFSPQAKKNILIAGIFLLSLRAVEKFIKPLNLPSKF